MKNITLSAQDATIDELRRAAAGKKTTVNELFRDWAEGYVAQAKKERGEQLVKALHETTKRTSYVKLDRKYTREEMNER